MFSSFLLLVCSQFQRATVSSTQTIVICKWNDFCSNCSRTTLRNQFNFGRDNRQMQSVGTIPPEGMSRDGTASFTFESLFRREQIYVKRKSRFAEMGFKSYQYHKQTRPLAFTIRQVFVWCCSPRGTTSKAADVPFTLRTLNEYMISLDDDLTLLAIVEQDDGGIKLCGSNKKIKDVIFRTCYLMVH